jgi:hypothetical protein
MVPAVTTKTENAPAACPAKATRNARCRAVA